MGITPDITYHARRPTLKNTAIAIIALIRMRNMKEEWDKSRKVHEGLVKKLEMMRRTGQRRAGGGNAVAA